MPASPATRRIQLAKQHGTWFDMDIYNDDYILATGTANGTEQESLDKEKAIGLKQRQTFQRAVRAGVKMLFGTDAGVYPHGDNAQAVRQDGAMGDDPDPGDPRRDQQRVRGARAARGRDHRARALMATSSRSAATRCRTSPCSSMSMR